METRDMTIGNPGKLILDFALPLMLGNIFQQLYVFVDTMVVGQALGVNALAALGSTEWLIFMMFGLIQGLVHGFSIFMAKYFGASHYKVLRKTIVNAGYLSILFAVVFTAIGQLIIDPILYLMRTPDEIVIMSQSYLRILYVGIPITMIYNLLSATLRALGNSKAPLHAVTISSFCNIGMDILFVFGFKWGIQGAALSTLLAELISTVYCVIKIRKIDILKFEKDEFKWNGKLCIEQLKLGIPMGLQNIITALGGLIVQSVINGFGVLFIAGYTAANKLYGLLEIAASSYGYAMSSYASQNIGATKLDRIKQGLRSANVIGIITALLMSTIMLLFGKYILACFITGDTDHVNAAIQLGYQFLTVLALFFPLLYILYILRSCVQGMGNAILPMVSSIVQLLMRTGCALFLPVLIGKTGIFYGEIFAWMGADTVLIVGYFIIFKKLSNKIPKKQI